MAGFYNEILHCLNVDFRQVGQPAAQMILDGQLMIASTSGPPYIKAARPTSNDGSVTWTYGSGTLDASVSLSTLFPWTDQSTNFAAAANHGYFIAGTCVATLPASPTQGQTIEFFVDGAFTLTIQANTGQTIQFATAVSSSAGTFTNTMSGDNCRLVYRAADTKWCASFNGAWNHT